MTTKGSRALRQLLRCVNDFGGSSGQRKLDLLHTLTRYRLSGANEILRFHEALCFLRAYPDDAILLGQVEVMLSAFADRGDVRRHRNALANTGVAGTSIHFRFFAASAHWLARRWGENLVIDWVEFENTSQVETWLSSLALFCETPGLDEFGFELSEWLDRLKGPDETDAEFLLRRIERLRMHPQAREILLDEWDLPLCLSPGPDTPARTREKHNNVKITYQTQPLVRARPTRTQIKRRGVTQRVLDAREGHQIVELARCTMATRSRDLDAFAYGSRHDVAMLDCGDGLAIACIGVVPERRLFLETMYGYLVLRNGVPVGYGTVTGLFQSAEITFTIFDTFRSGEASIILGWVLTVAWRLFEADTITVTPYQIGQNNEDAVRSGAWWFYYKLGFRPREPQTRRIMRGELRRMKSKPTHRSSHATLRRLAESNVFLNLDESRDDVLGVLPLANIGLHVSRFLADQFGADRERATRTCSIEARKLLGVRSHARFSPRERRAWNHWAPLVINLPNVTRWHAAHKRSLVALIRAKGSLRELTYLQRFNGHRPLQSALRDLAERDI